jgi:hypothetical protein
MQYRSRTFAQFGFRFNALESQKEKDADSSPYGQRGIHSKTEELEWLKTRDCDPHHPLYLTMKMKGTEGKGRNADAEKRFWDPSPESRCRAFRAMLRIGRTDIRGTDWNWYVRLIYNPKIEIIPYIIPNCVCESN